MFERSSFGAILLAAMLGATVTAALAWDDARYPDLKGQWIRGYPGGARFDPAKGSGPRQEAPLTAEYQAIYQADLAEQAKGKQGIDPTYSLYFARHAAHHACLFADGNRRDAGDSPYPDRAYP